MSFCYMNAETRIKINDFSFKSEKITGPANEFLLHECRNKNRKTIFPFKTEKKITSPANEFPLHKQKQ